MNQSLYFFHFFRGSLIKNFDMMMMMMM